MKARIVIVYPVEDGRIVLRTETDWERDLEPVELSADGTRATFEVESEHELVEFKACLRQGDALHWAVGLNEFVPMGTALDFEEYPHFFAEARGHVGELLEVESVLGSARRVRVYLPSGYHENLLNHYPVIYMQDGANLFLPSEAFGGQEWQIDETMDTLDRMNLIKRCIVVGIHAQERLDEYTDPGYAAYGRSVREEIKPWVDGRFRTLPGPDDTFVIGSSLGGVVSFFLGWEWPEVFGNVACLSSTFAYRDDLIARVRGDDLGARADLKIYLDSGWPGDNYAATLSMAAALISRGFVFGRDFLHCAFPDGRHHEQDWAGRCHLPIQFFCGYPRRISAAAKAVREDA